MNLLLYIEISCQSNQIVNHIDHTDYNRKIDNVLVIIITEGEI